MELGNKSSVLDIREHWTDEVRSDQLLMNDKIPAAGLATGPLVWLINHLASITDVLQLVLVIVSIFATAATGWYYWKKSQTNDSGE
jgi:hypothetical protein